MAKPLMFVPLVAVVGMFGAFYLAMQRENPNDMPSAFVGREAPPVMLEPLEGAQMFTDADLRDGEIKLVNYWASWCAPCRVEHPNLEALKDDGVTIYGVNWKDDPEKAVGFLAELGNPFAAMGADPKNRMGLNWGVAGVPETFVIDGEGKVLLRFAGPITQRVIDEQIGPLLGGEGE